MRVFLDFEASSLAKASYPIEVAWAFEDGATEAHLIRPAAGWNDWDPRAEALHGIGRGELQARGEAHEAVARRMLEVLAGHTLYASAPSWDGKWLSVLLRAAGLPRHALRLRDSDEAQAQAVHEILSPSLTDVALDRAVAAVLAEVRRDAALQPVAHRALADAVQERGRWLEARRLAGEMAKHLASSAV